ncbi:MAG: exopolyphosphatase [Aquimonas sp.]|jgi:exopolyphosphatase / guanosine-5'-triphosphate,3'-diphosphate pyrophosphatase|nr:exopolyphosphatase [Xanthomonadales bacterium]MCC6503838.1 exopolyphosphatase [Aquimonas sp.]
MPLNLTTNKTLEDGELLAAIDLGSNSFHMVLARYTLGQLRVVDRLRETVRMASGLSARGDLSAEAMSRALECLERMGQRLRGMPHNRVRAIATNTVRQLRSPASFLIPGETALGHRIEVVSGREEARLIYLGVAHGLPPKSTRRLVVDIGGGSTEFIIGEGFEPLERESLQMGCIASTRRFFPSGKLSRKKWRDALTEISAEFQQFTQTYRARGWREVIGSSGTAKAIGGICKELKISRGEVTAEGIAQIRERLLAFDDVDAVDLPGLNDERRTVMAGGLLVMEACFNELGIERMQIAQTAMREGVLYDMLGRAEQRDPRDGSIAALAQRYGVDIDHAARVEATVEQLFAQVATAWGLDETDQLSLMWAARIHEIGLTIAHSQHHVHGAYLIENSDIAGFSTQEQRFLGVLLRSQRRNLPKSALAAVDSRDAQRVLRCVVLLRLGVLLNRSHDPASMPPELQAEPTLKGLALRLPPSWLAQRPLSREDLQTERGILAQAGFDLAV